MSFDAVLILQPLPYHPEIQFRYLRGQHNYTFITPPPPSSVKQAQTHLINQTHIFSINTARLFHFFTNVFLFSLALPTTLSPSSLYNSTISTPTKNTNNNAPTTPSPTSPTSVDSSYISPQQPASSTPLPFLPFREPLRNHCASFTINFSSA